MTWVHLPYIRHKGEHNINFTYEYFFLIMLLNKSFFLSETENANFQHTFSYKKCLGKNQNRFIPKEYNTVCIQECLQKK